jgi:hypothetical protein
MTTLTRVAVIVVVQLMVMLAPLLLAAEPSAGRIRARVWPAFAREPADVRIDAMVEPRDGDRALRITVDNGEFFRSSTIALEGGKAARYYTVQYRALPEGDFYVQLELIDAQGVSRALEHQAFHVLR